MSRLPGSVTEYSSRGGMMMKLEMGYFHIKDVVFGEESKLAGNIVTVDKRAV